MSVRSMRSRSRGVPRLQEMNSRGSNELIVYCLNVWGRYDVCIYYCVD